VTAGRKFPAPAIVDEISPTWSRTRVGGWRLASSVEGSPTPRAGRTATTRLKGQKWVRRRLRCLTGIANAPLPEHDDRTISVETRAREGSCLDGLPRLLARSWADCRAESSSARAGSYAPKARPGKSPRRLRPSHGCRRAQPVICC